MEKPDPTRCCATCRFWAEHYNPFHQGLDEWGFCLAKEELGLQWTPFAIGRYRKLEKTGLETHASTTCLRWEPSK